MGRWPRPSARVQQGSWSRCRVADVSKRTVLHCNHRAGNPSAYLARHEVDGASIVEIVRSDTPAAANRRGWAKRQTLGCGVQARQRAARRTGSVGWSFARSRCFGGSRSLAFQRLTLRWTQRTWPRRFVLRWLTDCVRIDRSQRARVAVPMDWRDPRPLFVFAGMGRRTQASR